MTTPIHFARGVRTSAFNQLASTYNIVLKAGTSLIGAATWTKTSGRNGYWITPSVAPCMLRVWVTAAPTNYMVICKRTGAASAYQSFLSHATGSKVGAWQQQEFLVPARESESFNFAINMGGGALKLGDLIVWEEF